MVNYPLEFTVVSPGWTTEDRGFVVSCARSDHRIESYAYAVQEQELPGRFDADCALSLGVPFGPLFGKLKAGECVTLPDGRTIDGAALVGPARKGRRIAYTGDTRPSAEVVNLAANADVLIHEATYVAQDAMLADRAAHSTATDAARSALAANAKALILTHFSARYESSEGTRMTEFLQEARQIFPNALLAEDFWTYDVPVGSD
jgi:ribonuclease Z